MEISKKINIAGLNIDIHNLSSIGISFSGGADSSLLLYILLKNINIPLHIYTFLSDSKKIIAEPIAERVIHKCAELTKNNNFIHHKEYINTQTPDVIYGIMGEKLKQGQVQLIYTGMTKFPDDTVMEKFEEKLDEWLVQNRHSSKIHALYFGNSKFYRPFMNLNKKNIANLYAELKLLKSLFPLTRSCENINSPDKHCGRCFWCEERFGGLAT